VTYIVLVRSEMPEARVSGREVGPRSLCHVEGKMIEWIESPYVE
jgi:hypothetical protein